MKKIILSIIFLMSIFLVVAKKTGVIAQTTEKSIVTEVIYQNYFDQDIIEELIVKGKELIDREELLQSKDYVRDELDKYVSNPSDAVKEIINNAVDQVDETNYKNKEELDRIIENTKRLIDQKIEEELLEKKSKLEMNLMISLKLMIVLKFNRLLKMQ